MAVLAIGLLVAQIVSAILLYQASEQRRDTALVNSVAFRLVAEVTRPPSRDIEREERRRNREARRAASEARGARGRAGEAALGARRFGPPNNMRARFGIERGDISPIQIKEERLSHYEDALREVLTREGITAGEIKVAQRKAGTDAYVRDLVKERPRLRQRGWQDRRILVASIEGIDEAGWLTARVIVPERQVEGPLVILFQTLVIFFVLVLLLYWVLRRITRPLASLTTRLGDFAQRPDQAVMLEETGPADMRRLIAAHNAMEMRIAALLDEKDVMLGAIGHDLKTPLAALRVRIESVPDDTQRERMAATIEDITVTLDDILSLARVGRSGSQPEDTELGALAASVTQEFEDLGDPVTIADPPRIVSKVQVTWLKRALRNLIVNAVRYGGEARISVFKEAGHAVLRVEDNGPGIPPDQIADMLEPFARGEASRNRATGGTGLGLTLARAVAQAHEGQLVLGNRKGDGNQTGLRAELLLPLND